MKRRIYILLSIIWVFAVKPANAQSAVGKVKFHSERITATEDELTFSFQMEVANKAVRPNETLVLQPVVTDGIYKVSLKPILIQGRKVNLDGNKRFEFVANPKEYGVVTVQNGGSVNYTATVPVQLWMTNAKLVVERARSQSCSKTSMRNVVIAESLDIPVKMTDPVIEIVEIRTEPVFEPVSIADTLSVTYSFIIPDEEYDPEEPFKVYDEERETAMAIYFRKNRCDIDKTYMDNAQVVQNLIGAVNMIQESENSQVKNVVVAGFASPEGGFAINDRLAFERAVSVKEYIIKNTGMNADKLKVFNGSVDWRGVRMYAEKSDMPDWEKQQVLDIIDNTPIWDSQKQEGRLRKLMDINGGQTYWYMHDNIFPLLRNGAFIKVYYENNN